MKEKELRECAVCGLCGQKIGACGVPLFYRVRIERYGIDMNAVRRQTGLGMMLGAGLAGVMGPDEEMTVTLMEPETLTVCEKCSLERNVCVAALAEYATAGGAARTEPWEARDASPTLPGRRRG